MLTKKYQKYFHVYIAVLSFSYVVGMADSFIRYQNAKKNQEIAEERSDIRAQMEAVYSVGIPWNDMVFLTVMFPIMLGGAFIGRAQYSRKITDKVQKKAISLAQSGNFKNSADVFSVVEIEFKNKIQANWSSAFAEEIKQICDISSSNRS